MTELRVGVSGVSAWGLTGRDPGLDNEPTAHHPASPNGGAPLGLELRRAPDPERSARFPAGTWRKLSRLSRLVVAAAEPLVTPGDTVNLLIGLSGGEFAASVSFLESYFLRGAAQASPLAFQGSVHNAAAAQLSIGLGLRGGSETILGGEETLWRTMERGMALVAASGAPVLVVVAEDLSREVADGLAAAGAAGCWGEGAAAFFLEEGAGVPLSWHDGPPPEGALHRRERYPDEAPRAPLRGPAWDRLLGVGIGAEAVALAALIRAGSGRLAGTNAWLEVG